MSARANLIFGLTILCFTLAMVLVVIPVGIDSPSNVNILALSPTFWPNIIMGLMATISIVVIIKAALSLRAGERAIASASSDDEEDKSLPLAQAAMRFVACIVILIIYYHLLIHLGFVAGSILVIVALMLLGGERRLKIIIPLATLFPVGLYLFFTHVAVVHIPTGLFEGLL
jgi:putative tricarboxylic transport membrane protein